MNNFSKMLNKMGKPLLQRYLFLSSFFALIKMGGKNFQRKDNTEILYIGNEIELCKYIDSIHVALQFINAINKFECGGLILVYLFRQEFVSEAEYYNSLIKDILIKLNLELSEISFKRCCDHPFYAILTCVNLLISKEKHPTTHESLKTEKRMIIENAIFCRIRQTTEKY